MSSSIFDRLSELPTWVALAPVVVGTLVTLAVNAECYNSEGKRRPKEMLAIQTTAKGKVELCKVPVPVPKRGEMLVKVKYAPINPSDVYCAMDVFNKDPPYPHGIGFEGSGVVVGSGGGFMPYWATKRQWRIAGRSLFGEGKFWAEYAVVRPEDMTPLPDNVALREGCLSNINPLTALGMLVVAQEGGHKAIVHTAASSTLGLQLIRAAPKFNVKVVAVVRGDKNVKVLRDQVNHPEDLIVRTDVDTFASDLKKAVQKVGATLAFDAISGDVARVVYHALPNRARMHTYGELSGEPMPEELVKKEDPNKPYSYYLVGPWLNAGGYWRKSKVGKYQYNLLAGELSSTVDKEFAMNDPALIDAIYAYSKHQKSGKMVMKMP